jgi:hypothetical protein
MADLIEAVALVCFIFLLGVTLGVVIVTLFTRAKNGCNLR